MRSALASGTPGWLNLPGRRLPFFKDVVAHPVAIRQNRKAAGLGGKSGSTRVPSLFEYVSPQAAESFLALAIGFAVAGLIATGYQLVTERPASFRLLEQGGQSAALAAIPLLVFAAPFIIMRNTIRGRRIERRRFEFVMVATVIACIWSLMSGTVVELAIDAIRVLMA
jgi:hypothetical protein